MERKTCGEFCDFVADVRVTNLTEPKIPSPH